MSVSKYVFMLAVIVMISLGSCMSEKKKESLPAGVTSVVQHSIDPKFGGFNTETFYKNGQWFRSIAHFDNGARYYEKYYLKQDSSAVIHSFQYYPDGALMSVSYSVDSVPMFAQGFFGNGRLAMELNVPAGTDRLWDSTGQVIRNEKTADLKKMK